MPTSTWTSSIVRRCPPSGQKASGTRWCVACLTDTFWIVMVLSSIPTPAFSTNYLLPRCVIASPLKPVAKALERSLRMCWCPTRWLSCSMKKVSRKTLWCRQSNLILFLLSAAPLKPSPIEPFRQQTVVLFNVVLQSQTLKIMNCQKKIEKSCRCLVAMSMSLPLNHLGRPWRMSCTKTPSSMQISHACILPRVRFLRTPSSSSTNRSVEAIWRPLNPILFRSIRRIPEW